MARVQIPKIAELREAIKQIEENDPLYCKMSDFNGITIKKVSVNKDYDYPEEYTVTYDAKVHFFDESHEYYDCWMYLKDIMSFLKTPLS